MGIKHVQVFGAGLVVCLGLSAIANPGFTLLGSVDRFPSNYLGQTQLPSNFLSQATDVSFDGSVVVGMAQDSYGQNGVFRWTSDEGMTPLPIPADASSGSYSYWSQPKVSSDGSRVAGAQLLFSIARVIPYVWTPTGGYKRMQPPTPPLGYSFSTSTATDISGDGNFLVGSATFLATSGGYNSTTLPLRWDTRLPRGDTLVPANGDYTPANQSYSELTASSEDGSILIGTGIAGAPQGTHCYTRRFSALWDLNASGTPFAITDSSPCAPDDIANVISADGRIVLGHLGKNASLGRWTQETGFVLLDDPTASLKAVGISDDGMVAAVQYTSPEYNSLQIPLIWTPRHGLRFLEDVLEDQNVNLHNWALVDVRAVSGDGTTFVGKAQNLLNRVEAYKATINPYCPADVNDDGQTDLSDFFEFFNCFDAGDPCADIDGDGSPTLVDFFSFFNRFDSGC